MVPELINLPQHFKKIISGFTTNKVPEHLDAIVIGSGIGGLGVASILAKTGKRVLVLEQHDQAGGCCHTFTEKGFEFDVGKLDKPLYCLWEECYALEPFFKACGAHIQQLMQ